MKPSRPVCLELLGVRYLQQAVLLLRDLFLLEGMLSCAHLTTVLMLGGHRSTAGEECTHS